MGLRERSRYLEGGRKGNNLREGFSETVGDELGHESEAEICCQTEGVGRGQLGKKETHIKL